MGAVALAGCDDGVVIEVRTPGATDEVELFLGIEECGDCPGVSPSGEAGAVPLPGRVFFRDDSGNARRYTQRAAGGVASFHIKPSDVGSELLTLAAIARGSAVSATLVQSIDLDAGPQHYVLELAAARDVLPPPGAPDGTYVAVWEQPNTTPASACFAFERWQDQQFAGRAFIVPKDDPDCDGFTAETGNECNPYVANGSGEPQVDDQNACLVPETVTGGLQTCRIGGPACADGSPNETEVCAPSSYCVPNTACVSCTGEDPLHACLPVIRSAIPRLTCTVPMKKAADATHYEACTEVQSFTADLAATLGTDCVADDTPLFPVDPTATSTGFVSELEFPSGVANTANLFVKLKHEDVCRYRMVWGGDVGLEANERVAFVRFVVEPAGRPTVRLLMPLFVQPQIVTTCEGATAACAFETEGALDLFACLK